MRIYDPVAFEAADVAACMPMIISATCPIIILPVASNWCYDAAIRDAGHREHVSAGRPI
jgi:hypothetical protein